MHVTSAYDILNKNFLDCVVEAKNKADERKEVVRETLEDRIGIQRHKTRARCFAFSQQEGLL